MRAGVPIIAVFPQWPNQPLQKIFREHGRYATHAALGLTLELRMPATGDRCAARIGCNKLDLPAARCVAADAFETHCLTTDRKILGSKYCAAVRGFSILATRV